MANSYIFMFFQNVNVVVVVEMQTVSKISMSFLLVTNVLMDQVILSENILVRSQHFIFSPFPLFKKKVKLHKRARAKCLILANQHLKNFNLT